MQEVVLAKNLIIICHEDMIEWGVLEILDDFFSKAKWTTFFFTPLLVSDPRFKVAQVFTIQNHGNSINTHTTKSSSHKRL
jgi:hypothetical protein